jgi:hypothetical protein
VAVPSLGEAYISVHADTSAFQRELQTQVTASTNAVEAAQNRVRATTRRTVNDPEAAALAAQTAKNKLLYAADQQFRTSAAKKAERDILRSITVIENAEAAAYSENTTRDKAAADARQAIRDKDRADNKSVTDAYIESQRAVQAAERAAYTEHSARTRAAAAAERELARAAREADDAHRSLGDRLVTVSSALSRIGFTGQTRLLTLGLGLGAPIALLGAFSAAAAVATAAVTVFGVQSADAARSATLQFQSLGLTADQAKAQFAALQELAGKGLQIANLDQDASLLLQLGVTAQDTNKILSTLGDIFSKNGDTGATLQKDIDDTTKKFATLVNTAKVTPRTFATAVASLGIGVTAQQAFDQVKKNLDLTTKQLDAIIVKGKLSGSALAQAALDAATPGTAGALSGAVKASPTQALEALKSSAQNVLTNAFASSGTTIAGFIGKVSDQLNGFLSKFAPRVIDTLNKTLPAILAALEPLGSALIATMQLVGPAFEAIGPIVTSLSDKISGFFSQVNVQGSGTQELVSNLKTIFEELGSVFEALGPVVDAIGRGFADIAEQLASVKPIVDAITGAFKFLAATHIGSFIVEIGTVAVVARLGVDLLGKAIKGIAGFAAESVLGLKNFGNAAEVAGAKAAIAAAEVKGLSAAGSAAAGAGAVGSAEDAADEVAGVTDSFKSKLGKALNGASAKASVAIPLGIALYQIGHIAGEKLAEGLGQGISDSDKALQAAQDNATKMAPVFQTLNQYSDKLGVSFGVLSQYLNGTSLAFIADKLNAGQFVDLSSAIVDALESQGASAGQAATALEQLGVDTQAAQDAVNGINTTAATAQLYELEVQARKTAGAIRDITNNPFASSTGGEVPGSLPFDTAASDKANLAAAATGITLPKPLDFGGGGSGADTAAKAAASKIKAAFAQLNGDLKSIADKTSTQTADQIRNEFDALIKDLRDSGNKALVAGAKSAETLILGLIKKLGPLKDKLAAELNIAQAVKDSVIASGSIDAGTGIATTFTGIQNKLRGSVSVTTQFIAAIKKLQSEKLNRTSITQLINDFASDPAGALAAARALVSAGQAGITGTGGINDLQGQLTSLGNDLGNDVAGEMYKAGLMAADGLLEGLKAKEKDIEAEINKIGDNLSKNMKKKIKAHSPSEVFHDIGGDVVDGLVGGINGGAQKVAGAASQMGQTLITFGPGSVAVNNADPKNPAGSGLMVGHGIVGILERQRTQAVLMGVG